MNFITKLFNKKQVDYPESASEPYYYCGYEIEVKDGEHSKKTFWTKDDMTYEKYIESYKDVREKIEEAQKKLEAAGAFLCLLKVDSKVFTMIISINYLTKHTAYDCIHI